MTRLFVLYLVLCTTAYFYAMLGKPALFAAMSSPRKPIVAAILLGAALGISALIFLGVKEAIYAATAQRLGTDHDDTIGYAAFALAVIMMIGFRRRFTDPGRPPESRS
jgi:hypothetical protein